MDSQGGEGPDGPPATTGRSRVLLGAAVVGLLLLAPLVWVWVTDDRDAGRAGGQGGAGPTGSAASPGDDWRVETWRGTQLRVPADWSVGSSPMEEGGSAGLLDCGVGGWREGSPSPESPYVGRPVPLTDACALLNPDDLPVPGASYVWFGSPVDEGRTSWDNGYSGETVAAGGDRVTIVSDDPALLDGIVATVQAVGVTDDNGCPAVQPAVVQPAGAASGGLERLSVCVYDRAADRRLRWSGSRGPVEAGDYRAAVADRSADGWCSARRVEPEVVLFVYAADGLEAHLVDFRCGEIRVPPGPDGRERSVALAPETVEPWALPGIKAYVTGPPQAGPGLALFFRGYLG